MKLLTAFFIIGCLLIGAVTAQPETAIIIALGAVIVGNLREILKTKKEEEQNGYEN